MQYADRRALVIVAATLIWNSVSAKRIFALDSECTSCTYYTTHICVSSFLYNENIVKSIEKQLSSRFQPCLNGSQQKPEQFPQSAKIIGRGTVIVAMVECSSKQNWSELAEMTRVKWTEKLSCDFDALIVLFHQWKLIPIVSVRSNISTLWRQLQLRTYQLREKYESEEAEQLVDELLSIMDLKTRQPTSSTTEAEPKTREHVPNWAFIVIIVSILLSAVAFYIGTCINKKTSWRPFNNGKPKTSGKRRLWGAGFSGGIWGAS